MENEQHQHAFDELWEKLRERWKREQDLFELNNSRFDQQSEPYGAKSFFARAYPSSRKVDLIMMEAIDRNDLEILRLALAAGADWRVCDKWERTTAHRAAASQKVECLQLLLEFGADFDATDGAGRTVWMLLTPERRDLFSGQ